jgi:hypothetical protein
MDIAWPRPASPLRPVRIDFAKFLPLGPNANDLCPARVRDHWISACGICRKALPGNLRRQRMTFRAVC